jgi:hypothetical protein
MSTTPSSDGKPFGPVVKILTTVVLLAVAGVGIYLLQRGLQSVEQSIASRDWPTVEGEIISSAVDMTETPIKENGREIPNKKSRSYSPAIRYRYYVKDQELIGTRVTIEDESVGTEASARAIVDKYPIRTKVKVSYLPDQPATSVLIPGSWAGSCRWFLPGGAALLIPLLLLRAIWFGQPDPTAREVEADENHPARPRLLKGLLLTEEIIRWEPGKTVHIYRPRVGFLKSILGAIIAGLIVGIVLGLLPAIFFLSGRGVIFIAQFYLAVSALLSVAFAIGLMRWGRRREYLLDWALESIHWEIGWGNQDAPLQNIDSLLLRLPDKDAPRNHVVDSYRIQARIYGRDYTLLETNGNGQNWYEVRDKLKKVIGELAHSLNVEWTESQKKTPKPSR